MTVRTPAASRKGDSRSGYLLRTGNGMDSTSSNTLFTSVGSSNPGLTAPTTESSTQACRSAKPRYSHNISDSSTPIPATCGLDTALMHTVFVINQTLVF